jgi:hypothetical protein
MEERRRLDNNETWELQLESEEAQNFLKKKKKKYKTNKITVHFMVPIDQLNCHCWTNCNHEYQRWVI